VLYGAPKLVLCPLLKPNLYTSAPVLLLVLYLPVQIPDQPPFIVRVEPILPLTFVRELDHEWLVVSIILVSFWQS